MFQSETLKAESASMGRARAREVPGVTSAGGGAILQSKSIMDHREIDALKSFSKRENDLLRTPTH